MTHELVLELTLDVRPGGKSAVVMKSPEGLFLEVVPNRKLVTTDAYTHWTAEAKKQHEAMGFAEGWGLCAKQLEALAKTL
ncbi:MAG: hypothetical protein JNK82_23305 [Myxococcaceae bacterium]|nr:hypothetical protein [Myxococcaceae bacterium]